MYKIFMIVMVPILAISWLIYWLWTKKLEKEAKNRPKQVSTRLTKSRSEVTDWAQKMANFESPAEQARKRKLEQEKKLEEELKRREQEEQQ